MPTMYVWYYCYLVILAHQKCQQKLGHMLPLAAYLLKPVQRVLKYYLLLEVKVTVCMCVCVRVHVHVCVCVCV